MRQLELTDKEAQARYIQMLDEVADGDHMKVIKQIVAEKTEAGLLGEFRFLIEPHEDLYRRTLKLHKQLSEIV